MRNRFPLMAVAALALLVMSGRAADSPPPAPPNSLYVLFNGQLYALHPITDPTPPPAPQPNPTPQPNPGPAPNPAPAPQPNPAPPINPDQLTLGQCAMGYIMYIPAYHHQVATEVRSGQLKTVVQIGARGTELRDAWARPLGTILNNRLGQTKGFDAAGNVTNPEAVAAVFDEAATAMDAVITTKK